MINSRNKILSIIVSSLVISSFLNFGINANATNSSKKDGQTSVESSENFNLVELREKITPALITIDVRKGENPNKELEANEGLGSGFFITTTKIMTNSHVVDDKEEIEVILYNGNKVKAKVLNRDIASDIALLEVIEPGFKSPGVLKLGSSSKARIGDWVISAGTPYDTPFVGTIGMGIVSGLSRVLDGRDDQMATFIQTDAPINPGTSGGPLVNFKGEVIGINIKKIVAPGYEGLGLTIPIDYARMSLEATSKKEETLGISGVDASGNIFEEIEKYPGVFVIDIGEESIASKIGLRQGDVILEINGTQVDTVDKIIGLKGSINDKVVIKVMRNNKPVELKMQ